MKISLEWISDFVDLSGIEPEVIADRLTLSTAEVEGVERIDRCVDGVFVGEVVAVEPIAGASEPDKKLHAATVDCGGQGRYETVCGAPNVRAGMKAVFAPAGVTLAGGQAIRAGKLAGRKSEGVLCSAKELGMSRWHEIILECPPTAEKGAPLSKFIPPEDVLIEVDNKSLTHRPDLWGLYGFARELAAIFARELRPLEMLDMERFSDLPEYPIRLDDPENCPAYSCIEFEAPGSVPSPLWLQGRLHALDQRSHNLLVDLTNYVLLEVAQPTHAFDAKHLEEVRIAPMGKKGWFYTLDEQGRAMLPDDLMIWNEERPVALAGIMGGIESQVEDTTERVLLESANFKASRVRRTSVRLGLRTESSQRFEKSLPPITVRWASARILHLMEKAGVPVKATTRFSIQGDLDDRFRRIELPAGYVSSKGGLDIPPERIESILSSLGFRTEDLDDGSLAVDVPSYRSRRDLSIPVDIVEEVLRIYGYDNIEPELPAALLEPATVNKPVRREHKARRLLTGAHRFLEVQTYAWLDDAWLAKIGFDPGPTLVLKNPSVEQKSRLRTTLVPNLLALVPANRLHRDAFRLCELGRVFHPKGDGCRETPRLAGVSYQGSPHVPLEDHFRTIKGAVEELAVMLGCGPLVFVEGAAKSPAPWQAEGHWVDVRLDGASVGAMGVLTGPLLDELAETGQVVWFELEFERLQGPIYPEVRHAAAPTYPGSWQDFSLVWDLAQGYARLRETLDGFTHPLVKRRSFLAVYKGKGLPEGKGSYTFRYWLGLDERTLTAEDIDGFRTAFTEFLQGKEIPLR